MQLVPWMVTKLFHSWQPLIGKTVLLNFSGFWESKWFDTRALPPTTCVLQLPLTLMTFSVVKSFPTCLWISAILISVCWKSKTVDDHGLPFSFWGTLPLSLILFLLLTDRAVRHNVFYSSCASCKYCELSGVANSLNLIPLISHPFGFPLLLRKHLGSLVKEEINRPNSTMLIIMLISWCSGYLKARWSPWAHLVWLGRKRAN
jgi:hypothetical protein